MEKRRALDRASKYQAYLVGYNEPELIYMVSRNYVAAMKEHTGGYVSLFDVNKVEKRLYNMVKYNEGYAIVLCDGEDVIASIVLANYAADMLDDTPAVFITGFYVPPEYRKPGVATALLRAGRRFLRDIGVTKVAYAITTDEPDRTAYRRWGGKEVCTIFTTEVD